MRASLIVAVLTLAQTTSQSPNDRVLKYKVIMYLRSLHIYPGNNGGQYLAMNLIKYGYLHSNCVSSQDELSTDEATRTENNIVMWKDKIDLEHHFDTFYQRYVLAQGVDDAILLWYNFVRYYRDHNQAYLLAKFYTVNYLRQCPINSKVCYRSSEVGPMTIEFSERQCKKISLFIKDMTYRLDRPSSKIIPFPIPFDYYTIGIYLLRNYPFIPEDTSNVPKEEKIFQFEAYIKGALELDKEDSIKRYTTFLALRNEKEALIEADLKEVSDEHGKKVVELTLQFHKTITNMMVKGWEYVNN